MITFSLTGSLQSVTMSGHLDWLARSSDPYLRKRLEDELRPTIRGTGRPFHFTLTEEELKRYTRTYGEQFVADPCGDLTQFFDVINGRFFARSVPTQLVVLYLFGTGKQYRPNVGALSAAGEGIAGYCLERFGYQPLVRPLGVMPDAVSWTKRNGILRLALGEAKASTFRDPRRMLEKNVFQFFVDIKTRATGFRYNYEAYLICSLFKDHHEIECAVLHVDLGYYCGTSVGGGAQDISTSVPAYDEPAERLRSIIRLQAEIESARDEYLTGVLSEEATRSATLALLKQEQEPQAPEEVEQYIRNMAAQLGLAQQWQSGQELVKDIKGREEHVLKLAIQRYRKPEVEIEEED